MIFELNSGIKAGVVRMAITPQQKGKYNISCNTKFGCKNKKYFKSFHPETFRNLALID
jgi:hypothetical protein